MVSGNCTTLGELRSAGKYVPHDEESHGYPHRSPAPRRGSPTVPVRVDYDLTPLGRTLMPLISAIKSWAESPMPEVTTARTAYDNTSAPA